MKTNRIYYHGEKDGSDGLDYIKDRRCLMMKKNGNIGELNRKNEISFLIAEQMFLQRS